MAVRNKLRSDLQYDAPDEATPIDVISEEDDDTLTLDAINVSYFDASKDHLKYVLPFIPVDFLITSTTLVSGKLLTSQGSQVISALPYIYGFYGLIQSADTLFVGTGVNAANAHGEENIGRMNTILKQSMLIVSTLSIPCLILLYNSGNISRLIGAPNDVADIVQRHFNQYGWGVPLYFTNAVLLQSAIPFGTIPCSISLIAGTLLNCGLSFLFTKGAWIIPSMPIVGTALATSVTNGVSDLSFFGYMLSQSRYREIMKDNTDHAHWQSFKNIMNIGVPNALNTFSQLASSMVATTVISSLLNETALQQQGLTVMPMGFLQNLIAFSGDGAAIIISNQVGQKKYSTISKYVNVANAVGVLSGVLGSVLIGSLAVPYVKYFSVPEIATPEFISTTRNLLLLSSLNQTISSIGITSTGALRGIDDNWKPLSINLGLKVGLNLFGSFLLMYTTDFGVYSSYISDFVVSSFMYSPSLYYYCHKKVTEYVHLNSQNTEENFEILSENTFRDEPQTSSCTSFLGWLFPKTLSRNHDNRSSENSCQVTQSNDHNNPMHLKS